MRLKAVTNPSQGEGIAARQELANQRLRPKDSPLNPFHFLAVAMQDILINPNRSRTRFQEDFDMKRISRPETDRGQTLTSHRP